MVKSGYTLTCIIYRNCGYLEHASSNILQNATQYSTKLSAFEVTSFKIRGLYCYLSDCTVTQRLNSDLIFILVIIIINAVLKTSSAKLIDFQNTENVLCKHARSANTTLDQYKSFLEKQCTSAGSYVQEKSHNLGTSLGVFSCRSSFFKEFLKRAFMC